MSRPREQGTKAESAVVRRLQAHGLEARRLAEGGSADEGDVETVDRDGDRWVLEVRHRERMNAHRALAAARAKVDGGFVALWWKRTVRAPGNHRRTADGEPEVVVLPVEVFTELLSGRVADREDRDG